MANLATSIYWSLNFYLAFGEGNSNGLLIESEMIGVFNQQLVPN